MSKVRMDVTCQTTLRETWTFDVPDGTAVDGDNALDLLEQALSTSEPDQAAVLVVDENLGGEHDRVVVWVEVDGNEVAL